MIKVVKNRNKSQFKYQMVLYAIENLLPVKGMLKTHPSSGINNYIKMRKDNVLEKEQWSNSTKWKKIK